MKHRIYPHRINGRFYNPEEEVVPLNFWKSAAMFLRFLFKQRSQQLDKHLWTSAVPIVGDKDKPSFVWIGHATFLIQLGGLTILTDPLFDTISFLFPRIAEPGIPFDLLPKIDVVLISHNHPDHYDSAILKKLFLRDKPLFLVPYGDKNHLESQGIDSVQEFSWWERLSVNSVEFAFLPAYHWSQKSFFDRNKSLWGSWMIQHATQTVYFAGDTAYSPHFKAIAQEYTHIDVALMPIGPCEPEEWMKFSHVTAEDSVKAFLELGARHFVPMHWGTYFFGLDEVMLPMERLIRFWENSKDTMNDRMIHVVKFGEQKYIDS